MNQQRQCSDTSVFLGVFVSMGLMVEETKKPTIRNMNQWVKIQKRKSPIGKRKEKKEIAPCVWCWRPSLTWSIASERNQVQPRCFKDTVNILHALRRRHFLRGLQWHPAERLWCWLFHAAQRSHCLSPSKPLRRLSTPLLRRSLPS